MRLPHSVSLEFPLHCCPQRAERNPILAFLILWFLPWPCFWQLTPAVQDPVFCYTAYSSNCVWCWCRRVSGTASICLTWFHQRSSDSTLVISAGDSDTFKEGHQLQTVWLGFPLHCLHFAFPGHFPHFPLLPAPSESTSVPLSFRLVPPRLKTHTLPASPPWGSEPWIMHGLTVPLQYFPMAFLVNDYLPPLVLFPCLGCCCLDCPGRSG